MKVDINVCVYNNNWFVFIMRRVYLDWNATAPLRKEAREAIISSLDIGW
jgi:hypothetical protein